jgi:Aspartyl/Asparaginyl beta-hydroxylase
MLPLFKQPFMQLPFGVDTQRLQTEVAALLDLEWLAHPEKFSGNLTLPLIAVNGQYNHDFANAGQMLPTPALILCPYIRQVLARLNVQISRTRLMLLRPGAEVSRHYDAGYHWYRRLRIHIPIFTHPDVIFGCAEMQLHMRAGEAWCFDHKNWHWVKNNSPYSRIHLVIDTKGSPDFFMSLSKTKQVGTPTQNKSDKPISLEPYVYEVLEPNEISNLITIMMKHHSKQKTTESAVFLDQFEKKWKATFLKYGHQPKGEYAYQSLINEMNKNINRSYLNQKERGGFDTIITMLDKRNGTPDYRKLTNININFERKD